MCKENNHVSNLEWCNHKHNMLHYFGGVNSGEMEGEN